MVSPRLMQNEALQRRCVEMTSLLGNGVSEKTTTAQAMLLLENNKKVILKGTIGISELLILFKCEHTTSEIPFRPRGGDLFVYENDQGLQDDWKADGHGRVEIRLFCRIFAMLFLFNYFFLIIET